MPEQKTCFVVSPIGGEGSDIRERSDTIFEEVIEPTVSDFNYECKRSDQIDEPGIITNQIIEYIVESELVIADLTSKNPNVFYELAVRHAHQKPVIQLIHADEDIPFDVATQRTIDIDLNDYTTTNSAKQEIERQVQEIESEGFQVENPVSVAGYIRNLRESGEPEKEQLAELTEVINEINTRIRSVEKSIDDPQKILPPEYFEKVNQSLQDRKIQQTITRLERIEHKLNVVLDEYESGNVDKDDVVSQLKDIIDSCKAAIETLSEQDVQPDSLLNY
jgi:exonuclease VII small subunit